MATTRDRKRRNGGFFGRTAVHPCKADDHERIVQAAEAVAINHGAVKDFQGEESPAATVDA